MGAGGWAKATRDPAVRAGRETNAGPGSASRGGVKVSPGTLVRTAVRPPAALYFPSRPLPLKPPPPLPFFAVAATMLALAWARDARA